MHRAAVDGVDAAAALASGDMNENPLDDLGSFDAGDDAQRAATHPTVFDVDVEHALEPLSSSWGGVFVRFVTAGRARLGTM